MTALFQQLPSVDKILKTSQGLQLITEFGHSAVVETCRELLTQARQFIQKIINFLNIFLILTALL